MIRQAGSENNYLESKGNEILTYGTVTKNEQCLYEIDLTADPVLVDLLNELSSYPLPDQSNQTTTSADFARVAVPFHLATEAGVLSFISTTTVFGTPIDITLSELALESFCPADALTFDILNQLFRQAC